MKFQLVVSRFAEKGRPAELRLQLVGDSRFVQVSTPGDTLRARLVKDIKLSSCLLVSDIYLKALFAPTFKEAEPAHVLTSAQRQLLGTVGRGEDGFDTTTPQRLRTLEALKRWGYVYRTGADGPWWLTSKGHLALDEYGLGSSTPADVSAREEEEGGK